MTSGWYYAKAGAPKGHEVGPFSWEELYLLARDGTLAFEDLVWNPKLPRGIAAGTVPGLFHTSPVPEAFPAQAPVPTEFVPLQPAQPETQAREAPADPAPAPSTSEPAEGQPFPPAAQPMPHTPAGDQLSAALAAAQAEPLIHPEQVAIDQPPTDLLQADSPLDELATVDIAEGPADVAEAAASSRRTGKQTSSLPLLVVLLAVVIAAAGLVTYFLFFRDALIDEQSSLLPPLSAISTLPFSL